MTGRHPGGEPNSAPTLPRVETLGYVPMALRGISPARPARRALYARDHDGRDSDDDRDQDIRFACDAPSTGFAGCADGTQPVGLG
jgi:hypothetical protein